MDTRELYSIEEARFMLGGISRATIYELLNNGELPGVVIGRCRFVPAAAIATSSTTVAPSQRRASGRHRSVQMPLHSSQRPQHEAAAESRLRAEGRAQ